MPEMTGPGPYVAEVPAGIRPVTPAPTSRTLLVGTARSGPPDEVVEVAGTGEYDARFGRGPLRRAVRDLLAIGGTATAVLRVTDQEASLAALRAAEADLVVVEPGALDRAAAYAWCEEHRAFLVTAPDDLTAAPPLGSGGIGALLGVGAFAGVYFPGLRSASGRVRSPAAAVAGVLARTDRQHGVWHAPAGTEASLAGAEGLTVALSSAEADRLTSGNLNVLRTFAGSDRPVVWGARTAAADPEWRYVPVRRTVSFVERSLQDGLGWVVFEPNGEPLWAQVRLAVATFLLGLFQQGAFPGRTADEAFFVRCDRSTMTDADVAAGRLLLLVGLALTRPAEFVLLRVEQATRSVP